MKLLSVTVPCYNSQDYMRHCVETLLPGGDEPDARFAEALSPVEKQRQEVDPTALVRAMAGTGLALRRVTSYPAPGQRLLLRMDFARP